MTFQKRSSAGFLANHMARLFAVHLQNGIRSLGLAPAQFMTLLELWESEGLTQRELCARLDVEQATMANTLSRMERDGLVRREPHPDDRRASRIFATEKAMGLEEKAKTIAMGVNQKALKGLPEKDIETFLELSRKVIHNLDRR